jgi:autotransporter-associated beta strand protein
MGSRVQSWGATFIWNGGGADVNWSSGGNWSSGIAPANNGTAAIVLAGTNHLSPNVDAAWDISSLTFSNGAGAFVLGGGALNIRAGGVTNNSPVAQTVNNAITLATNQSWNAISNTLTFNGNINNGGNLLTIAGNNNSFITGGISGAGGLTKSGTGTNFLSGANTFSGLTTVSAGALNVQNNLALGGTNSGTTVASGASLFLSGGVSVTNENLTLNGTGLSALGALRNFTNNNSWNGTITLAAAATIGSDTNSLTLGAGGIVISNFLATFTGGGNIIANGSIGNGTNGLTKAGAGTLTLTASNSYGGLTTVSAGVLNVQNNFALGGTTLGTTVASGAQLQLQNGASVAGETLSLNGTGITGSGVLRNVSGSNTWSGLITLAASATIAADAGTLDLEANISNSTATATFTNAGTIILNGVLGGGTGAFVKNGIGLLSLGGANTYTGTTTISGGTVQFTSPGNLPAASAVTVNAAGILDLNNFNKSILSLAGAGGVTLGGGILTVNNSAATTFSGVMSGAGTLVKNGAGTFTLGGVNTFSGGTTINAGAISIAADGNLGNTGGALTLNGGTLITSATLTSARAINLGNNNGFINAGGTTLTLSGTISGPGALTQVGTKTLALTGANTYLGGTTNAAGTITIGSDAALGDPAGSFIFSNSATLTTTASFTSARNFILNAGTATFSCGTGFTNTFNGVISGAGALTQSGAGMMVLGGSNTFTNLLTISKGTVQLGGSERISDLAPVLISATTATFDLNNFNETIGSLASSAAGSVKLGGGLLTAGGNNLATTNSAVISGNGGFTKTGTGVLTFSGANTYTSNTIVAAGTLQISASERIANTSPLVISNGAVFNLNNFSETVASLAGAGGVTLGTGTLTAGNTGTANFSGTISGTGAFTKVGTGSQIFSGANSYTGATTISVGNLQVNGSSPNSAVTIASAATLSGGGTVGTVAVNSGATNSPGASTPGTLTSGTETWAGGGNYVWEINNAAGAKGVNSDWLNISGALNITATSGNKFNLRLVSLTPANATGQVVNFDNTLTYVWTIASASGGISGFNAASFNVITTGFQNALGAGTFTLSQSGNDLNLIFTSAAAAAIKGVQSGTLTSNGNGTNTATLGTPVNPTNAFLIFNTRHNSGVPGGSMIRGSITSSNTVTFVRATTENSTMNIQWYVVEYSAGVRVQRGEVNQTNTTINVPLAPLGSVGQAFVTWSKTPDPSETSFSDSDPVVGEITSNTNLQFRVSSAPSSVPIISWQVVEFLNPASISVQKGSVTNLTGTNLLAAVTLPAPVNTNSTFLLTGYRTSGSGTSVGARMLRAQLTSATNINFDRSISGAPDDISEIEWQSVQLNDGSLVQSGSVNFTNGVAETNVALISLNTNSAAAFSSVQPAGGQNTGRSPSTGNVLGVGSATLALTSNSQLTLDRNNTSDQADLGWQVVGFGSGSLLVPATGGSTISADTTTNTYTSLTGPLYTEIQSGNVGVGTIVLKTPAGFIFDTNTPQPNVLITRASGSGANSLNLNGVASGTSAAMTTVNQTNLIFTVTSASSNGVTCSLTWQNLRVRPTTGTNLASGNLVDTGTSVIQGVTTNSTGWGFLAEVTGAATKLAITTQPSTNVTAGVDFPVQPVVQIQDQFGNLRTTDNSTIITAASSGTDTNDVNGSITAVGGVAAFGGLDYRIAQTNTITFSAPGFASKTSGNIVVSAAAASQLTVVTQPSATATAGVKFAQQPVVQVQDAFGNLIKTDNSTTATAVIDQGSTNLLGTQTFTATNGVITFTNLSYPIADTRLISPTRRSTPTHLPASPSTR